MDCDKFEATMLDELYGELDELTLAASRRHVGGCARCGALMAGLRATRKLVTLPVLAPSAGFEGRLLSAVEAAEKATKPTFNFARLISLAGTWAMRPQTAMAAVLLLMVGTSSVFLSRKVTSSTSSASSAFTSFTVTENGVPAAAASAAAPLPAEALDTRAAAAAHGVPTVAAAAPARLADNLSTDNSVGPGTAAVSGGPQGLSALGHAVVKSAPRRVGGGQGMFDDVGGGVRAVPSPSKDGEFAPPPPPAFATRPPEPGASPSAFDAAKDLYHQGDYAAATQAFDGLAAGGDANAALWAAKSARDGAEGCGGAAGRFDQVATSAWGTSVGYEATFEAASCYARMGQADAARTRYARLLTVPSYAARAQSGIIAVSVVAAKPRAKAAAPSALPPPSAAPAPTNFAK
jgi:TolA-binding protein